MRRIHLLLLGLGAVLLVALAALLLHSRAGQARVRAELAEAREAATRQGIELRVSRETAAQLEQKLTEVAEVLSQTTEKLAETSQRLAAGETRQTNAPAGGQKPAGQPVANPAPAPERELNLLTLAELPGAKGGVLATNVTFAGLSGRRLIFRRAEGPPTAFDVDDVHPATLARLNVDPDAAKQRQYELDQQKRAHAEAAARAYQTRLAAAQKLAEQEAARRRDQAREAEEQRKIAEERALKLEALEIERQKAQAALRQADAAIIQALNPVPVYVNPLFNSVTNTLPSSPSAPNRPQAPTLPTAPTAPIQPQAPTPSALPTAPTQPTGPGSPAVKSNKAPEPRRL